MSDTVTVTAEVKFKRWQTPNFATRDTPPRPRQEGFSMTEGVPIRELPAEALDALARAWLADLYRKVNRSVPVLWE